MKGVKFLSLKREFRETFLLPHKLEVVDAVLRDLESSRPQNDAPIAAAELPATSCIPTDDVLHTLEEVEALWPVVVRGAVKTPFLASMQYDCLDGCADTIYNLIGQFESPMLSRLPTILVSSDEGLEMANSDNRMFLQQSSETIGVGQCRKLEELSEWRQQLMARLNSYDISGTVFLPQCTEEL